MAALFESENADWPAAYGGVSNFLGDQLKEQEAPGVPFSRVVLWVRASKAVAAVVSGNFLRLGAALEKGVEPSGSCTHIVLPAGQPVLASELAALCAAATRGRPADAPPAHIVSTDWATDCLRAELVLRPTAAHAIRCKRSQLPLPGGGPAPQLQPVQPGVVTAEATGGSVVKRRHLACQPASGAAAKAATNARFNAVAKDVFHKLAELEGRMPSKAGPFKGRALDVSGRQLDRIDREVDTPEEALRVADELGWKAGSTSRDILLEVVETGRCVRLETLLADETYLALCELAQVWGLGFSGAHGLLNRGIKTIPALRAVVAQDARDGCPDRTLTGAMRVALPLLEDFKLRIPRDEVEAIGTQVCVCARALDPSCLATIAGSFRRGAKDSGDIDVIVTGADGRLLRRLVDALLSSMLITHELRGGDVSDDNCATWNGVARLPGSGTHFRRLDIKFYPPEMYAYALLAFTGSDHFNRSMRWYADRVLKKSLSDKGLVDALDKAYVGAKRVTGAESLPALREEDIFAHMRLDYVAPRDRSV